MSDVIEPTPNDCGHAYQGTDGRTYWVSSSVLDYITTVVPDYESMLIDERANWRRASMVTGLQFAPRASLKFPSTGLA